MTSPRTGDWVRARADTRDPTWVEGALHLRLIPARGYIYVLVLSEGTS